MRRPTGLPLALALVLALTALPVGWTPMAAQDATPGASPEAGPPPFPPPSANVSVFAEGLDNPRGLEFGPDGALYVAEGGRGGAVSTEGQCEQVVPPVGPYTGGENNSRISRFDAGGGRTTVVEGIPSTQTAATLGSLVSGVADLAFVDGTLHYLLASGGCSHGNPDTPNGVFRANADGTSELVADLSAFVMANPTRVVNPADFEPDESAYGLESFDGELYVAESNHGALDAVDPATGAVRRVMDLTETEGHLVPTAMAVGPDGNLYLSNLTTFPVAAGAARVFMVTPEGQLSVHAEGLTAVLGLAFDDQGRLYVLETSGPGTGMEAPIVPGSGRVVRLADDGRLEVVATGLVFPTGMAFGPDGKLYVSNFGFGFPPGAGQVVRIDPPAPQPPTTPGRAPVGTPEGATPVGTPEAATPVATNGDQAGTGTTVVDIKDFAFGPPRLEVAAGTTVTWTNRDAVPHTATDPSGAFDTGRLDPDASAGVALDAPGTHEYVCLYHPTMKGTVVVT